MHSPQPETHSESQHQEKAPRGTISKTDAQELAESYAKLASVYARIAGIKSVVKSSAVPRVRDPNRPKRPPTAYILFSLDKRPVIAARHEGMRSQDVAVEIGKAWRALSEAERREYDAEAKARRDQFFSEIDVYNKTKANGTTSKAAESADSTGDHTSSQPSHPAAENGNHDDGSAKKTKKKRSSEPGSAKKKSRKSKAGHEGADETHKRKKRVKQQSDLTA
ncbi:hypothetical protein IWW50_003356 [Coemansia erecta]|nr:hypothetical protein GGF43_001099 [Coemansia sp. RSA 2618]KAJ2824385.1 hypothetical protein IWW50_003356 [Coemansia erecta]